MKINVSPELKPLYANLLRLGIGKYLISKRFDHLCIENNIDQLWNDCEDYVRSLSNVAILVPGYTGYAEEALGIFLTELLETGREKFIEILGKILCDFVDWRNTNVDLSRIKDALLKLGYTEDEIKDSLHINVRTRIDKGGRSPKLVNFKNVKEEIDNSLCFVLMPFDEKFTPIYENIIKKVVEEFDLNCKRADEIFGTKPIIEDIWQHIQKARILLADLTDRNPNVFYELGLAHAIGKDTILITQELNDVPFDLRHYRCIVYEDSISGAEKLKEGIKSTLKEKLAKKH